MYENPMLTTNFDNSQTRHYGQSVKHSAPAAKLAAGHRPTPFREAVDVEFENDARQNRC